MGKGDYIVHEMDSVDSESIRLRIKSSMLIGQANRTRLLQESTSA